MIKYKIIETKSSEELEQLVNKAIEEGWTVTGGVATNGWYCQALVK